MSTESTLPRVVLFDANGVEMSVQNGVATPAGTGGLLIAGSDGANSRFARIKPPSTPAVAADPALVVAFPQPITVQFGFPGGTTALPKMINLAFSQSLGAIVANGWRTILTYTTPVGFSGYLIKFTSFQDEAALSRVVAEQALGSHNASTNVFTAGTQYTAPQFSALPTAEVTTQLASGSGSVVFTVGYTNQDGTAGRTGTFTVPKGSVVGSQWEFTFQTGDYGLQSIQSCSAAPTQVGVISVNGHIQLALHNDQASVASSETLFAPGATTFPSGTIIQIEFNGGSVSKKRLLDALIQLVAN